MVFMRVTASAFVLAMAILAPQPVAAKQPTAELQALDDALPGNLINDPSGLDWVVFGSDAQSKAVKGTTAPGGGALQITTPRKGATLYEIGTNAPIMSAIIPGQRITVAFYARTLKAETADKQGVIGVRFQQNAAPYPGFGDTKLAVGPEWQLYEVTALSDRVIPAGQAVVGFQLSGAKQTIEIGQTIVVEGASTIVAKGGTTRIPTPVMLPQLEGKGSLINDPASTKWEYYGASVTHKIVPAKGMPGDSATQFTISTVGANAYDSGVNVPIAGAITEGDVMIIAVLARTVSVATADGLGKLGLRVQQNSAPYPGFGEHMLAVGPNWKLFQIKTRANISVPPGKAAVGLHLGDAKQVIEIGRVYVLRGATP
jgi:hypothetical protein